MNDSPAETDPGMAVPRVEMLRPSELQEPPYAALLQPGPRVERILAEITGGRCSRLVAVARTGGAYYPVGGLDVLEAYRRNQSEEVPCMVTDTDDLLGAHMSYARSEIVDPARMLEYAVQARGTGSLRAFSKTYTGMAGRKIAGGVLDRLSAYVRKMAEGHGEVPSTFHILPALARLDCPEQEAAMETVMRYSRPGGFPPDGTALKKIVGMHAGGGGGQDGGAKKPGGGCGIPGAAGHDCPCGKRYVMERNGTVRELREAEGGAIILDGDHGEPVYGMPRQAASHLGLEGRPRVHHYRTGEAVIISRVRHPAKVVRYIGMLLDPARRGPLVERLGRIGS